VVSVRSMDSMAHTACRQSGPQTIQQVSNLWHKTAAHRRSIPFISGSQISRDCARNLTVESVWRRRLRLRFPGCVIACTEANRTTCRRQGGSRQSTTSAQEPGALSAFPRPSVFHNSDRAILFPETMVAGFARRESALCPGAAGVGHGADKWDKQTFIQLDCIRSGTTAKNDASEWRSATICRVTALSLCGS